MPDKVKIELPRCISASVLWQQRSVDGDQLLKATAFEGGRYLIETSHWTTRAADLAPLLCPAMRLLKEARE